MTKPPTEPPAFRMIPLGCETRAGFNCLNLGRIPRLFNRCTLDTVRVQPALMWKLHTTPAAFPFLLNLRWDLYLLQCLSPISIQVIILVPSDRQHRRISFGSTPISTALQIKHSTFSACRTWNFRIALSKLRSTGLGLAIPNQSSNRRNFGAFCFTLHPHQDRDPKSPDQNTQAAPLPRVRYLSRAQNTYGALERSLAPT